MNEEKLIEVENQFFSETKMDLYVCMELYVWEYPYEYMFFSRTDLQSLCKDEETTEDVLKVIATVKELAIKNRRKGTHQDKTTRKAFQSSRNKSLLKDRLSLTQSHREAETLFDEDKVRSVLAKHPRLALNPLCLVNGMQDGRCRIPFVPSKSFFKRYDFLEREYHIDKNWRKRYSDKYFKIDVNKLQQFLKENSTITLCENDIEFIYFALYSPYLWWLIQNNKFWELRFNWLTTK